MSMSFFLQSKRN